MIFSRVFKISRLNFISLRHWNRHIIMPPPDRWGDYSPFGAVIQGTSIFCCKVPLKNALVQTLPEEERFTPEILIERTRERRQPLGLIIDLTFTKKYYSSIEFTSKGIQYEKIFTKGHEVPSDQVYGKFASVLDSFFQGNQYDSSVVGVHCTHGVNRTGYLVCRYLIEKLNMAPDDAIDAFNTARGHRLERENYLADLRLRLPGDLTPFEDSEDCIQLPRSSRDVENSYSRLKEQHQRRGPWSQQQQRDYYMRDERRGWNQNESTERGNNSRYNGQRNSEGRGYRGQRGDREQLSSREQYGGYEGDHEGPSGSSVNFQSHNYSSRGRGRHRSNQQEVYDYNHGSSDNRTYDSGYGRSDRYGGSSYDDQDYGYSGLYTAPRDLRRTDNRHDYNRSRGEAGEYRSPMRYADWAESDQHQSKGWGQGHDRRRGSGRGQGQRSRGQGQRSRGQGQRGRGYRS